MSDSTGEFDDFMNGVGDNLKSPVGTAGDWFSSKDPFVDRQGPGDRSNASGYVNNEATAFDNVKPPTLSNVNFQGPAQDRGATASQMGPSAANGIKVDPSYTDAQTAQMTALGNLARNGGRSAASDANLAAIQQRENANARGQQDAILQGANARGQGGGGAALLAQLSNSQNATNNQSAEDLGVAGQQAQTALSAGQGAAAIGSNLRNQSYGEQANTAAANDAVNRFNAGNNTGVSVFNSGQRQGVNNATAQAGNASQEMNNFQIPQTTFGDTMGVAGGRLGANKSAADYWGNMYKTDEGAHAGQTGAIIGGIGEVAAQGAKTAGSMGGAAAAAAHGGQVGGRPSVPGDSYANDTQVVRQSPGEVDVPRSLALGGSRDQIADFVQNPPRMAKMPTGALPPVAGGPAGGKDKEAMLSALKRIAMRKRG